MKNRKFVISSSGYNREASKAAGSSKIDTGPPVKGNKSRLKKAQHPVFQQRADEAKAILSRMDLD